MNEFLRDILDQPATLRQVLSDAVGPRRRDLAAAAAMLRAAPAVVVTSMGSALLSCMPVARALARLHPNARLEETSELLREAHDPRPLYLMLSRSGESREVVEMSRRIRERGGSLIAITMTPDSTMARNADLVLHDTASFDGFICTKAFTSLILVGLLAAAELEGTLGQELVAALDASLVEMARVAEQMRERIAGMPPCEPGHGLTFLSEGAGLALAHAGALWTEEAARVRASASSFSQFRHGPIEQVDGRFRGCWIDLAPSARSRAMFDELRGHGGRVEVVSLPGAYDGASAFAVGGLPENFRVIAPALAVQLIAWRVASAAGEEPGAMRYLEWVVR
jgi:glucosamine--fructose-6-phosphate aminotransferase (isomerizing)